MSRTEEDKQGLDKKMAAVHLRQNYVFANVSNDIEAVKSDFFINEVNKHRCNDVHQFKALNQVMLVGADKSKVSQDKNNHAHMLYKLNFSHLLMKHRDHSLSLLSELIECILLLLFDIDRLAPS